MLIENISSKPWFHISFSYSDSHLQNNNIASHMASISIESFNIYTILLIKNGGVDRKDFYSTNHSNHAQIHLKVIIVPS